MLPFFGVAHGLTRWSNLPPDGFSLYYQHAAGLAGMAAFLAGLALLRVQLSRHFTGRVTLATLATVTPGTNLLHYGVDESTFSHAFSFFLIAALVVLTERWWERPDPRASLLLAVTAGLLVLTRHPNALFLAVVPLYGVTDAPSLRNNLAALRGRRASITGMIAVAFLVLTPQLATYKYATGHWFVSAYGQIGSFTFASPHLWGVLFGVQKGLFFTEGVARRHAAAAEAADASTLSSHRFARQPDRRSVQSRSAARPGGIPLSTG